VKVIEQLRVRFSKPNFALFRAQGIDIACRGGVGLSTRWG
jgi:hypothetical protein